MIWEMGKPKKEKCDNCNGVILPSQPKYHHRTKLLCKRCHQKAIDEKRDKEAHRVW